MGRRQTDRYIDWAEYQNDQKTKPNWGLKCPNHSLCSTVNRGMITPCCCICCITFCNSHPFSCGVDLQEIRIFPVAETAKNSGFKKKKKNTGAKISVIILHKLKEQIQEQYFCFSGAYQSYLKAECFLHRNHTKSSYSCNFLFFKMYILSFSIIQSTVVM